MPVLSIVFIIFVAALPGIAWLIFFLKEDIHPEPRKLVIYTFAVGVFISLPIILIQTVGEKLIFNFVPDLILLVVFFALVEEVFKFFAAWLAAGKSKELDEPIDAMIYMIAAALGLATIENFFILSDFMDAAGIVAVSELSSVIVLRSIGATFLHAIASGFVGYYWAKSKMLKRRSLIIYGIFLATIVHVIFNYLIIKFQTIDYLIYPSLFLVFASIFLFKDFNELRDENAD